MNQIQTYQGMVFVGGSILFSSLAQLLMKAGMLTLHGVIQSLSLEQVISEFYMVIPTLNWVAGGLICYLISLLCWLRVLAQYELSLAYPLLSMNYVLVYLGASSWPLLNESISMTRTVGIVLILLGVLVVARTETDQTSKINR